MTTLMWLTCGFAGLILMYLVDEKENQTQGWLRGKNRFSNFFGGLFGGPFTLLFGVLAFTFLLLKGKS